MKIKCSIKTGIRTATAVAAVSLAAMVSPAQVVSVNIVQNPGNNNQQIDIGETFGIPSLGSVVGGWNNLNSALLNLPNSLGIVTTVDFALTQPNGQATFNNSYTNTPLFAGLDDYTTTVNPVSITLSDLNATFPLGFYAIAYVGGFNSMTSASITDGTTTFFYRANPTPPAGPYGPFSQTTQTTDLGAGNNPIAQYAVFGSPGSPLTANSITFTLDTLAGGVQFVAVPEPALGSLLAIPGLALLLRRKHRP
jgi:hypothetical protein